MRSTHNIGGPLTSGVAREGRLQKDLRTKVCVGKEENGSNKCRRASFTCMDIDRNVNIAQLFLKVWTWIQSYIQFSLPYLL